MMRSQDWVQHGEWEFLTLLSVQRRVKMKGYLSSSQRTSTTRHLSACAPPDSLGSPPDRRPWDGKCTHLHSILFEIVCDCGVPECMKCLDALSQGRAPCMCTRSASVKGESFSLFL